MIKHATTIGLCLAALWAAGCKDDHAHEGDGEEGHAHVHEPLFGGALTELGDHAGNLELVLDPAEGVLTVYLLDGHATEVVRSAQTSLELTVEPHEGEPYALTLEQVETAFGEKKGDSSTYRVADERLKGLDHLHAKVASVSMKGMTFDDVEVGWPAEEHGDHDEDASHGDDDAAAEKGEGGG